MKTCPDYKTPSLRERSLRDPKGPYRETSLREPKAGGIAESVEDEVRAERGKLDLRKTKMEHQRLDQEERDRAQREQAERERVEAEDSKRFTTELRRGLIQRVKGRVATSWAHGRQIPAEVKTQALQAVEEALGGIAVDLPDDEILGLAKAAWGGVVKAWENSVDAAEELERRKRHEAAEAKAAEERRQEAARLREWEAARRLEEKKQSLVKHCRDYLQTRLNEEEVDPLYQLGPLLSVPKALENEITGTESRAQVEELTEEILGPELKRLKREATARQQREEEERREEAERKRQHEQWEREQKERREAARLEANRRTLIRYTESCATHALTEAGIKGSDFFDLLSDIKDDLRDRLTGNESERQAERILDEILDELLPEDE